MAEIFSQYPEITDVISESADKAGSQSDETKKIIKRLRKIHKQLKHQNKIMNQFCKCHVEKLSNDEGASVREGDKGSKTVEKKEKTFLEKLGDVFLKTLPKLLQTAVTVTITAIFRKGFKGTKCLRRKMS